MYQVPFILSKIWLGQASIMKNKWLRGDNSVYIQGRLWGDNYVNIQDRIIILVRALPFPSLLSICKPSFIKIPRVLSKIWPGQASIMKNKWLRGDNTVNIQGRIMVIMHCPSSHCHPSINQVSFQSL